MKKNVFKNFTRAIDILQEKMIFNNDLHPSLDYRFLSINWKQLSFVCRWSVIHSYFSLSFTAGQVYRGIGEKKRHWDSAFRDTSRESRKRSFRVGMFALAGSRRGEEGRETD